MEKQLTHQGRIAQETPLPPARRGGFLGGDSWSL